MRDPTGNLPLMPDISRIRWPHRGAAREIGDTEETARVFRGETEQLYP